MAAKRRIRASRKVSLRVPASFSFKRAGTKNFGPVLDFFNWSLKEQPVEIDFTGCSSANYQSLALLAPYCWHLKQQDCTVSFKFDTAAEQSSSRMWTMMGGHGLFAVATDHTTNFKCLDVKPLIAVRNPTDLKLALERSESFVSQFGVEYQKTIRYLLAELLYNATEHGRRDFRWRGKRLQTPSILQMSWYERENEIDFLVADIGMGVHAHLARAYPAIASDDEALRMAVQPEISGTFGRHDPYSDRNNAGMGLYLSSSIVRRLRADMYLVSGGSVLHVSPNDLTSHSVANPWPGTFVFITMRLDQTTQFVLDQMMQDARQQARIEVSARQSQDTESRHYLHIFNFFGKNADDKDAAIGYRKKHLLKAVDEGKVLVLDFDGVASSTHSFLNALLASPVRRMGMSAYKRIKITRALPEIRETIDYVLDDNTSPDGVDGAKYVDDEDQLRLDIDPKTTDDPGGS